METSSKRPKNISTSFTKSRKHVTRDPRFDDLSGTFDEQMFKKSYKFVDKIKAKEKKVHLTHYHYCIVKECRFHLAWACSQTSEARTVESVPRLGFATAAYVVPNSAKRWTF